MEVAYNPKEKGPLIIAAITLGLVGLLLVVSTWQGLRRQREAVESHMLLTAQAVLNAVEGSLRRGMPRSMLMGRGRWSSGSMGMMHGREADGREQGAGSDAEGGAPAFSNQWDAFRPDAQAYFRELEESGEVLFVGIFDKQGGRLLSSRDEPSGDEKALTVKLPPGALADLARDTRWHGMVNVDGRASFVYGQLTRPGLAQLVRPGLLLTPGQMPQPQVFLLVGLDTSKHMSVYLGYRRNALYQSAFVLAAGLLIWFLAMGFLRRRALAGRAVILERFQSRLLDNLPDGLLTLDSGGVVRSANPAAHAIFGMEPGALVGTLAGELPLSHANDNGACMEQGQNWQRCDHMGRHLEVLSLAVDEDGGGRGRLVLLRDRTEHVRLEARLAEARKLAAVGTLAAGVAHEIRNPLSALRGLAQHFAKKFKGRDPEETYARTMVHESDRLNRVVTDLLFLAKPRPMEPAHTPLASLADELARLLAMDLEAKGVTLSFRLETPDVYADRDGLKQALLNLVINALDAVAATERAGHIEVVAQAMPGGVRIGVADNGPGMDEEQKAQAFEPFFTNKKSGTGLGLAIVHKTLRDHGGEAIIETQPGAGATVWLFFPDEAAAPRVPEGEEGDMA
ncbi:MAG: nitrogen regulation protein NR(II) [Desulfovibrionaceae bacterium]